MLFYFLECGNSHAAPGSHDTEKKRILDFENTGQPSCHVVISDQIRYVSLLEKIQIMTDYILYLRY